jgi:integrase
VTPQQAAKLIDALPTAHDRALWGTALYAGLRRGELLALMWEDVDVKAGQIHVQRSWDIQEGHDVGPKSAVGNRKVPIASAVKARLAAHRLASPATSSGPRELASQRFGTSRSVRTTRGRRSAIVCTPMLRSEGRGSTRRCCWNASRCTRRAPTPRLMIAAGVNAKALSTYMGHANISITLDRYGHLMPGNEAQAAKLLDAYLAAATV